MPIASVQFVCKTALPRALENGKKKERNSNGYQKWMPKDIVWGCALHRQTTTKRLVNLFSKAIQIYKLRSNTLGHHNFDGHNCIHSEYYINMSNGAAVPPNFLHGRFVNSTTNIAISDEKNQLWFNEGELLFLLEWCSRR